jgi:hypothetical protein
MAFLHPDRSKHGALKLLPPEGFAITSDAQHSRDGDHPHKCTNSPSRAVSLSLSYSADINAHSVLQQQLLQQICFVRSHRSCLPHFRQPQLPDVLQVLTLSECSYVTFII